MAFANLYNTLSVTAVYVGLGFEVSATSPFFGLHSLQLSI